MDRAWASWRGGNRRPEETPSIGAFRRFSVLKSALLQPGIPLGATASLIGVDFQEVANFIKEPGPTYPGDPDDVEVRLAGHHIHFDVCDWSLPTLEIGDGKDIIALGAASDPVGVQGVGLRHQDGGQILLPFAGYFRGAGAAIFSEGDIASDASGAGSYAVTGFAYVSRAVSYGGGLASTVAPGVWYRRRCAGNPASPLVIGGITKPDLSVVTPPVGGDEFTVFMCWHRASGDSASLLYGGWRHDDTDAGEEQGVAESLNITATATDREIMLGTYDGGSGTVEATWHHVHVTDTSALEAP